MIDLQSFVNFMKVMDIASTREEASNASECMHEIEGVQIPFADTLNITNGLNYAQFLEAILRIAYYKKETSSDQANNQEGYKNTLEAMFADAELDIKKKAKGQDDDSRVKSQMLDLSSQGFFSEHFDLLAAIFSEKGMIKGDGLELDKAGFITILKESKILITPQKKAKEETKGGEESK